MAKNDQHKKHKKQKQHKKEVAQQSAPAPESAADDEAFTVTAEEKENTVQMLQQMLGVSREEAEQRAEEGFREAAAMTPAQRAAVQAEAEEQMEEMQRQAELRVRIADPGSYVGTSLVANLSLLEDIFNARAKSAEGVALTARDKALMQADSAAVERIVALQTNALQAITAYKHELTEAKRAGGNDATEQPTPMQMAAAEQQQIPSVNKKTNASGYGDAPGYL